MARRNQEFQTIRSEGGLLPSDLLRRVLDPRGGLAGTAPEEYGLPVGERLNEAITQSWTRLLSHWAEFREAASRLPAGEAGTGLTNDRWNLPLLRELGYGLLPTSAGPEIDGRTYAISRFCGTVPIHVIGCGLSLDHRAPGQRGAAAAHPHGLVQDFLNRSDEHLWALLSNGLRLRLLRDSMALSRQSFLEFDLESMLDGEVFSDFVLLWLTAHATHIVPVEDERPDSCWLEQWTRDAEEQGTRALGDLRGGVQRALQVLGEGFTSHPRNTALREALRAGTVSPVELHAQLLRVVYRFIFLFVAEDRTLDGRSLLHPVDETDGARIARERYSTHYSTGRLREMAGRIKGSRHGDLWRQFQLLLGALSGSTEQEAIRVRLALPSLGSFLWTPGSTTALNDAELTNHDLLEALRNLAFTRPDRVLRPVDYMNLGAEELGGIYESLLTLTPQVSADGGRFSFAEFAGNQRKTSGSYYTPDVLVQCLLDSALDPVVAAAIEGKAGAEAARAILALRVCDPAVGSGHFLVGAAHRLARHLARARALADGESEPSPLEYQHALREVVGHCLYGVDMNPMAAELCRVSLWLEAVEPGKPLSFLDHHIRVGNSLLGTTPELITAGLPDDAFKPIEGDDKKACVVLKKRNRAERKGLGPLFAQQDADTQAQLRRAAAALEELPDDRPSDIQAKELAFRKHEETEAYRQRKGLADAWCAAFVNQKHFREPGRETSASGITQGHLNDLASGRALPADLADEAERLSRQYQFFHWHLAFPEVFARGGFDCVLGNPPWDQVQFDDREFFASRAPEIASAANMAKRQRLIGQLVTRDPRLHLAYRTANGRVAGTKHFIHASGRYPLTSFGRINLAPLFVEFSSGAVTPVGWVGTIVPSGIAFDSFNQHFFRALVESKRIASLYEFENEGFFSGAGQGHMNRFCLLTLTGSTARHSHIDMMFQGRNVSDLGEADRRIPLNAADFKLVNPNTGTCPIFRTRSDAELARRIYRSIPVVMDESMGDKGDPWRFVGMLMFMMNTDSARFRNRGELEAEGWVLDGNTFTKGKEQYLPLYEGKMVHLFNHRHGDNRRLAATKRAHVLPQPSSTDLNDPDYCTLPHYWMSSEAVVDRLKDRWDRKWLLGWRDVTDARASARTVVASVIPLAAVGHKLPLALVSESAEMVACFASNLSAFALDYVARQKVGGLSLTFFTFKQLPVIPPSGYSTPCEWDNTAHATSSWLLQRAIELMYASWDMAPFAQDCGLPGAPFCWDEERRFLLRCELDAAFFHLYLSAEANGEWQPAEGETAGDLTRLKDSFETPRDAVAYMMDTFPIVRRKDEELYGGDYRTKRVILEIYDALAESIFTGQPYQTRLDPPPADVSCRYPPR
jgi:hypothetical protein